MAFLYPGMIFREYYANQMDYLTIVRAIWPALFFPLDVALTGQQRKERRKGLKPFRRYAEQDEDT
jgi:hypothetical protein